jgi:hypothetical protein
LLWFLSGCASNPQENILKQALAAMDNVRASCDNLKTKLAATTKAIKDEETASRAKGQEPTVPTQYFDALDQEGIELEKVAKALSQWRTHAESYKDQTTPEEREKFRAQFQGQVQNSLAELDTAYRAMKKEFKQLRDAYPRRTPDPTIRLPYDPSILKGTPFDENIRRQVDRVEVRLARAAQEFDKIAQQR